MVSKKIRCLALLTSTLALCACSDADRVEPSASASSPVAKAVRSSIEYASMKDVRDINPHLYLGEMAAQAMVFESLVVNMPDGSVQPALAQSWEISPDGRTYTFHLRAGVKFTDGEPFNAQAVKKNVDAVLANRSRHAWLDLVNEIESNEAVDELTWRLTLKHPYFPTLIELGVPRPFRFISPRCMKDGQTKDGVTCLAGTGPWVLSEHKRNQYALFTTNADYWGEKPKVASVRWNVLPDAQTMLLALEKGEIDLMFGADGDQLTSDAMTKLQKQGKLNVLLSRPIASRAILLNTKRPITGDAQVREAIQCAIDRQGIINGVLNGLEEPAQTLFAKNVPYCNLDLRVRPFDPEKAKQLLDEAGWKLASDGVRSKNGQRCEVSFYYNSQNTQEKAIAETVQANLADIGVAVRVIGEEKQTFLDRQRTGEFDLQYSLSWGTPYDPQSYLSSWRTPAHGDYQAQAGMSDKAYIDQQIGQFMIEGNEAERRKIATDILTRIHNAAVYVPISFSRTKAVHSKQLTNVEFASSQYEIPFEKMQFVAP